jgi:predicted nucleic acid-binding protein
MKYVLDSCVAVKWYLSEADSPKALQLRADFQTHVHELLAPDILRVEVAHALTRAERQGIIAVGDADLHLVDLLSVGVPLRRYAPLLRRAVAISSAARVGVYDCLSVALAESEGCELVTADTKLIKNLQKQFPFIRDLASVP